MNKFINIISILLFCFSVQKCKAQKITNKNNDYMEHLITSDFEKLDINNKELLVTKSRYGTTEPPKFIVRLNSVSNDNRIETYGLLGVYYDQWLYPKKGWFEIYKSFYSNGNIKKKFVQNKTSDEKYGKLYEFDEQGHLVKTTDFDEGWTTSFETVTEIAGEYAKKYKYKVETSVDDEIKDDQMWKNEYAKIWRKENQGKKYWIIGFNKAHLENQDDKKTERLVVIIDDSTGKVLETNHYFDWYNRYFKDILEPQN